ncbi:MAG: hypothetical protein Q7S65_00270 [Nanoarchaeota archaeon]|nr:hypothetical protein [Nanoarchaeota archaeon]
MKKLPFVADLMLWFVVLIGFLETVFALTGVAFYTQFVLFIGIFLLALLAMLLVNVGVRFGHFLSGFAAALTLMDLTLLYFLNDALPPLHFAAMVATLALFVFDILLVGGRIKPMKLKTYTRVVAGINSKYYHLADSAEAKRIKKKRVFESVDEAKKAGLKPGPSLR